MAGHLALSSALILIALPPTCCSLPTLRIAVVHKASESHPGVEFAGLDRFEALFGDANRSILPNHEVVFDRITHGPSDGDASEVFGEISAPWSAKYVAAVGFDDDSMEETARFAATQRIVQVHHARGPHLSDRSAYPYQFRTEPAEDLQIMTQFYMAARNGWTQVVGVWNSAGSMESSQVAAQRYGVSQYRRLRTRRAEEHIFRDVAKHISVARTRTVMSLQPLDITIDLVCFLHVRGHRGLQYFFPLYHQMGWWLRVSEDYPCTPQELYGAALGHVYVVSTPFAPGTTFMGSVTIPPLAPFGDQSEMPLACGGGSAQTFFNDFDIYHSLIMDYGVAVGKAAELFSNTGREYTALCATMLALHSLLYEKGASLGDLENRDWETFHALVDSLQEVQFQTTSGTFQYKPGSGDPVPVFLIAAQFAEVDNATAYIDLASEAAVNVVFTFLPGGDLDPTPHFFKPLVWRGGSTGLSLDNAHLNVFPKCSDINQVLHGEVCQACKSGSIFDVGSHSCVVCPLGSYQNESGKTSCESSPAGFYIPDVTQPNDILPCPVGTACPQQGTLTLLTCHAGQYAKSTGQSACTLCEQGSYQTEPGASACRLCSSSFAGATTPDKGANSYRECVCVEGTYRGFDDSIGCQPCPAGLVCSLGSDARNVPDREGLEHNRSSAATRPYPHAKVGFMTLTENPLFAYQCLDDDPDTCPGGPPGTCGSNKAHDVIACGECNDGSYESSERLRCDTCGSFSWLPTTLLAIAALFACVLTTVVTNTTVHVKPSIAMTVSAVFGLMVTSSQTLHMLLKMETAWGGLFTSIANVFGLSLKSKVVKLGCVVGNNPLATYVVMQLLAPLSVPVIALILRFERHLLPKITRTRSPQVPLLVALSNTAGTIVSALFISIVLLCAVPFICYSHEGTDVWSLLFAPSVLCYSFQETQYLGFVVAGLTVFFCLPLPFLVACMYFCMKYPRMVLSSEHDDYSLRATRFLFYRFKPCRYYFIGLLLGKHLILGLVPAVLSDQSPLQALTLALVLAAYIFTQAVLWPWRSSVLNVADALACLTLLLIVVCGCLGMNGLEVAPLMQMVDGLLATFLFVMLSFACLVGLHERFNQQKYHFFICHHKAEAGAQARYLKMVLHQFKAVHVFIDSDDLCDLDVLFDTIKTSVQQLILYLTSETLHRPWCVGEVVTSMKARLRILPVHTKTFSDLSLGYIEEVVNDVVAGSELTNFEIEPQDIRDALVRLMGLPSIQLGSEQGSNRFYALAQDILSGTMKGALGLSLHLKASSITTFQSSKPRPTAQGAAKRNRGRRPSVASSFGGQVLVSTLSGSDESLAAGGIIKFVVGEKVFRSHNAIVSLLEDDVGSMRSIEEMASSALAIVMVLTPGTLHSPEQIRVILVSSCLIATGTVETCLIPVTTPGFVFPDSEYYRHALPLVYPDETLLDAEDVLRSFFRVISIFLPTHGSQQVLETSCEAILDRLNVHSKSPALQGWKRDSSGSRRPGKLFARSRSPGSNVSTPSSPWSSRSCMFSFSSLSMPMERHDVVPPDKIGAERPARTTLSPASPPMADEIDDWVHVHT